MLPFGRRVLRQLPPLNSVLPVLRVAVAGFEPAIQSALEMLLSQQPGLELTAANAPHSPDVMLIAPTDVGWVHALHQQHPACRLFAMVEWSCRHLFQDAPLHGVFDRFHPFEELVGSLRCSV